MKRLETHKKELVAAPGETWILRRRNGTVVKLMLSDDYYPQVWVYPDTKEVYGKQDTVGLVRRVD